MISISKKDIIWNYLGSIINISMNVLILPAVLNLLTTDELGLWYVFGSVASLIQLMDFGFAPAITRNVSYAWSGVKELVMEGITEGSKDSVPNYRLLSDLLAASKKIYMGISIIALTVMLSIGTLYVKSLVGDERSTTYITAWVVYSIAVFVNLYFNYWSSMLRGIGKIKETNQATLVSRFFYIFSAIFGLLLKGGLLWLSISFLVSGAILSLFSVHFFKIAIGQEYNSIGRTQKNSSDCLSIIWPNAKKQGIVTVGGWLITRANTLICSTFFGLEVIAQYGLSLQLLQMVGGISSLLFSTYIPELVSLKVEKRKDRYTRIFSNAIIIQWTIALVGIFVIVLLGPITLRLIGSNAQILPTRTLILLSAVLFLEWNHSTFATLITLSNRVPFVSASLLSGVAIVVLALLSVKLTNLGILGLVLAQGIVQLAYNNWYWPREVLKENRMTIKGIITSSVGELKIAIKKYM